MLLTSFCVSYHPVLPHHPGTRDLHPQSLLNHWWWVGTFPPLPQTFRKGQRCQLVMLFFLEALVFLYNYQMLMSALISSVKLHFTRSLQSKLVTTSSENYQSTRNNEHQMTGKRILFFSERDHVSEFLTHYCGSYTICFFCSSCVHIMPAFQNQYPRFISPPYPLTLIQLSLF